MRESLDCPYCNSRHCQCPGEFPVTGNGTTAYEAAKAQYDSRSAHINVSNELELAYRACLRRIDEDADKRKTEMELTAHAVELLNVFVDALISHGQVPLQDAIDTLRALKVRP